MKGKIFGASLIVAGTAIGAGMLAIPLVTGELGFLFSVLLLLVCWGLTIVGSLLMLHINMAFKEHSNLSTMASYTIGRTGSSLTWVTYLLLLYSLIAAYMTGGSSLLAHTLTFFFKNATSHLWNTIIFTLVLGSFVYFGTRSVDYANRLLVSLKMGAFFLMVILLMPHISGVTLDTLPTTKSSWLIALPILMTSFAFQIVIPSIRDYLDSNIQRIKLAIYIGGSIPLLVYILWVAVIFGTVPDLSSHASLTDMVSQLETRAKLPFLSFLINFFTDVAVTTSFLGVSMALFHFIRDGFHLNRNRFYEKGVAILLTFVPPFCFTILYPKGFILALNYASIFVVLLQFVIPVWMAFRLKKKGLVSKYPYKLHWINTLLLLGVSAIIIGVQVFKEL